MDAVYSTVGLVVCWVAAYGIGSFVLCLATGSAASLLDHVIIERAWCSWIETVRTVVLKPLFKRTTRLLQWVFNHDVAEVATIILLIPIIWAICVPLMLIEGICVHPYRMLTHRSKRRSHMEENPNAQ